MRFPAKVVILHADILDFTPTGGTRMHNTRVWYQGGESNTETDEAFGVAPVQEKQLPPALFDRLKQTGTGLYEAMFEMKVQKDKNGQNQQVLKLVEVGKFVGGAVK